MKIEKAIWEDILITLRDYYPHPLMSDGYSHLSGKYGEETLDGHLVYLAEKNLIDTSMEYVFRDEENDEITRPTRGDGEWLVNPNETFINAGGHDYLSSQYL